MSVSTLEYANLATEVYLQNGSTNIDDWEPRTTQVLNGMSYRTYFGEDPGVAVYKKGNEVVIAFDGWEGPTPEEFGAGLLTIAGLDSAFYAKAYYYAKEAIEQFGANKQVTFVGHSQGGAFAGLMAAHFEAKAITFNAQSAAAALPETALPQNYYIYEGEIFNQRQWNAKSDDFQTRVRS